jgi:anaerobic selenocysteine-containing dehydrogenase
MADSTGIPAVRSWGHSTVQTACPLDCPDSCSLAVTVERGKVIKIDGSREAPSTDGYICGKVRGFGCSIRRFAKARRAAAHSFA